MRGALIFTAGIMAGFIMMNPAVQHKAKEGISNLMNYTKEKINEEIFNEEDKSEADNLPDESLPQE